MPKFSSGLDGESPLPHRIPALSICLFNMRKFYQMQATKVQTAANLPFHFQHFLTLHSSRPTCPPLSPVSRESAPGFYCLLSSFQLSLSATKYFLSVIHSVLLYLDEPRTCIRRIHRHLSGHPTRSSSCHCRDRESAAHPVSDFPDRPLRQRTPCRRT